MSQVTFNCGWCRSKDQTADILHSSIRKEQQFRDTIDAPYLVVLCRRCKRASSLFWSFQADLPPHLEKYRLSYRPYVSTDVFEYKGDITEAFTGRSKQAPSLKSHIATEIPEVVREAILDAYEGRSPRAKCQHYRTAIEFALREAGIATTPGKTLGGLLSEAKQQFAISDALIELCDVVKAFGNWGAHWRETDISEADERNAEAVTSAILEYLFVLPAMVQEARQRAGMAKQAHNSPTDTGNAA